MVRVNWGVLGCANIAKQRLIPGLLAAEHARLRAVASRSRQKAEAFQNKFGADRSYASYDALLADPAVSVVYVPLPNQLHMEWTIRALQAGKHVLCEKPIGLNATEAREMQAVAKETGQVVVEALMYRYAAAVQRAFEIVREGAIGRLTSIHSAFSFMIADDPTNVRLSPETGGGALYDVGCYCVDVIRMLAGRQPTAATCECQWSDTYGVDMAASGILAFADGLSATFSAGFRAPGGTFFRAEGTEGTLVCPEDFLGRRQDTTLVLRTHGSKQVLPIAQRDPYMLQVEDLSLVALGTKAPCFGHEPLDGNMQVVDACYASARSGRTISLEPQ